MTTFRDELRALLNRYSMEKHGGDTSDFILADYLIDCLRVLDTTVRARNAGNCLPPQSITVGGSSSLR